jgi:hypothetical protein
VVGGSVDVGTLSVEVSVVGGRVSVEVSLVVIPVPGPVMKVVGRETVEFGVGSSTLVMTELISLKMELRMLPGSLVLDAVVVTMPVGANRISDDVVVGTGDSC